MNPPGQQIHHQHQHGNELLAGRELQPRRTARTPDQTGVGSFRGGQANRQNHVRCEGMGWSTTNTDVWRMCGPIDGAFWGMWPCGGARGFAITLDPLRYGGDLDVLRSVYPIMRRHANLHGFPG